MSRLRGALLAGLALAGSGCATSSNAGRRADARLVVVKGGKVVPLREVSVDRNMKWIGK